MSIIILGIESSCDDTSAAVIRDGILLSNVIASQKVHEEYGGVVPELASRAHQQNIVPVVDTAIKRAGIDKHDLSAIAFTRGPGLLGSLLVGTSFAKGLSLGLGVPIIDVNHLHGHVLSHFIRTEPDDVVPEFPYICLLISGGNSQIILVKSPSDMEVLGQTMAEALIRRTAHRPPCSRRRPQAIQICKAAHRRPRLQLQRTEDIVSLHTARQHQARPRLHREK